MGKTKELVIALHQKISFEKMMINKSVGAAECIHTVHTIQTYKELCAL